MVFPMPVMLMVFVMMLLVGVLMLMRFMAVVMMMLVLAVFLLLMAVRRPVVDGKLHPLDILPHLALPMGVEIADLQLAEFPLEGGRLDAQVAQGAHGHIAADSGEAIEVEHTHRAALFH
jgi:hypothetical protein